jgi:hypothetical protein
MTQIYLEHRSTYDHISKIINEKRIERRRFVSFADGFAFLPMHGDSSILFNKEKVESKYKLTKIIYDKDWLEDHPEIFEHVLEYKSVEEHIENIRKMNEKSIKNSREQLKKANQTDVKIYRRDIRESFNNLRNLKKKPIWTILEYIKGEDEYIADSPFEFEYDDICHIIYSSDLFQKHFPIPKELSDKIDYYCDYFPHTVYTYSPIHNYLMDMDRVYKERGLYSHPKDLFDLHYLINAIKNMPDWEQYVVIPEKRDIIIPERWLEVIKKIDKISDIDLKIKTIGFIITYYIFSRKPENQDEKYQNALFDQCNAYL